MSDFHFLYPWRLLALVLTPLLFLLNRGTRSAWTQIMDRAFAQALIKQQRSPWRTMLPWMFALGVIALAAPSWQKEQPAALTPQTNVMFILQQDLSMLASDLPPSRHQRMQHKITSLLAQLPGTRAGLVVYRGAAFLTTPLTDDQDFFSLFLNAQQPTQLPDDAGSGLQAAIRLAQQNLPSAVDQPRSLILVADNLSAADAAWLAKQTLPIQVWVPGTAHGGRLPDELAASGIDTRLNVARFSQLRDNGVPVTLAGNDDQDLKTLVSHIQQDVTAQQQARQDLHWKDSGYLLVAPLLLMLLLWRQQLLCLALLLLPLTFYAPVSHAAWLDAWISPDKQGQLAFDRGDYSQAAEHFDDPVRRGIALYYARDFVAATAAFRDAPATAESLLWLGNCYAQQKQWQQALNRYDEALSLRPDWAMAQQNRAKVADIVMQLQQKERERQDEQRKEADESPDEIKQDLKKNQGVNQKDMQPLDKAAPQVNQWYDNLSLSPGGLLENLYHSPPAEAP